MWAIPKDHDRNQEATVWVGNLDQQCTEELVWELCCQAGPVVDVTMPRDKITGQHNGYSFVEFKTPEDADYCIRILNMIKLYGKHIKVNKAAKDKGGEEDQFAANLFVRNLHPDVDNKFLYDTFAAFGCVLSAKVMTEDNSPQSKGYAFVSFDTFESADSAIAAMDGQYLMNRPVAVSFAYKKDGTRGERHGDAAERMLAAQRKQNSVSSQALDRMFPGENIRANAMAMFRPPQPPPSFGQPPSLPSFPTAPPSMRPQIPPAPQGMSRPQMPQMPMPPQPPQPPRPPVPPTPPQQPQMPRPPTGMPQMPPGFMFPGRPGMPMPGMPFNPMGMPPMGMPPGMGMPPMGMPPMGMMPPGMPGMPGMMPPGMQMGRPPMMPPPGMPAPGGPPPGLPTRPPNLAPTPPGQ
jgi:splicing factor 3B subunit 4